MSDYRHDKTCPKLSCSGFQQLRVIARCIALHRTRLRNARAIFEPSHTVYRSYSASSNSAIARSGDEAVAVRSKRDPSRVKFASGGQADFRPRPRTAIHFPRHAAAAVFPTSSCWYTEIPTQTVRTTTIAMITVPTMISRALIRTPPCGCDLNCHLYHNGVHLT